MLGVERAYALTLVWHLYCIYAMQAEVDHFVGMARKQIETLWKQYVTSEYTRMSLLLIHCLGSCCCPATGTCSSAFEASTFCEPLTPCGPGVMRIGWIHLQAGHRTVQPKLTLKCLFCVLDGKIAVIKLNTPFHNAADVCVFQHLWKHGC